LGLFPASEESWKRGQRRRKGENQNSTREKGMNEKRKRTTESKMQRKKTKISCRATLSKREF
jgi:hypothetical protein